MKKILVIGLSGESVFLNVERLANDGQTLNTTPRKVEPGGKGYNQAIAIGALGGDVSFITTFGLTYNEECKEVLKKNNVKLLEIKKEAYGSYAVIIVDKDGNNKVIVDSGASTLVTFLDILSFRDEIDKADIILLQLEYPSDVIEEVIKYASSKNKLIILNPAPKCNLSKEVLEQVTYLTPNEFEKTLLPKLDNCKIITTLGDKGASLEYQNNRKIFEAVKVNAIDTTGAGDVFNGSFAFCKSLDMSDEDAINFAICASAYKVCHDGVVNSLPTYDDVVKILSENKK